MSPSSFLNKLRSGDKPIGTFVSLGASEVPELLSACGYDWLTFDMEHACLDAKTVLQLVQATQPPCSTIVRVPENSPGWIKRILDAGCDGVMVPHVNSRDEASAAVAAVKYPPLGSRSVGAGRAQGYGATFTEYLASANDSVALIVQIEHRTAVANVDAIVGVPGVDAVLIGPYDLSGSMNLIGQLAHPDIQSAITWVKDSCNRNNTPVGIFVMNPEDARRELNAGCDFVAFGVDAVTLSTSARANLQAARGS